MALAKSKYSEIPDDAVVLTERQALKFQSELIKKWHNSADVFSVKYGPYFLGGAALLNGFFLNNHFRRKLMLGSYGRVSSYLPICIVPAATSIVVHAQMVLNDVMLMKGDQCPVCLELRAAAFQSMLGTIFPLVVAPIGCAAIAQRYSTFNLPYVTEKPGEVLKIFKKMFKPIMKNTWYMFLAQALLGSIVTYFESKSVITINLKLASEAGIEDYS